jgi:hypothetical protein
MFKLMCKNCGHEDDVEMFIFDADSFQDKFDERITCKTITIECPMCGFHHHIEN